MKADHLKAKNEGPLILSYLTWTYTNQIQNIHLKMSKGWTNSKLIDDVTIKYHKSTYVIVIYLYVSLDRLGFKPFNSFTCSVQLFQIPYCIFVMPCKGSGHHFNIWMDLPEVI